MCIKKTSVTGSICVDHVIKSLMLIMGLGDILEKTLVKYVIVVHHMLLDMVYDISSHYISQCFKCMSCNKQWSVRINELSESKR